jgi:flavin-dependent dehydrogenase
MSSRSKIKVALQDGSNIAVIGGGPAGSFFTYYALEFADRLDLNINIDIYEAKNFTRIGAGGCNHCGGIISESLVQKLSTDGIIIPAEIIQRGINTYTMHVEKGDAVIQTPSNEHRIASVFRGCGPRGCLDTSQRSFDNYLLDLCREKGAQVILEKVTELERCEEGIIVKSKKLENKKYDLVVGAVGLNKKTLNMFQTISKQFVPPQVTRTYISEFYLGQRQIDKYFGGSMHVFLLNLPNITFGALIPKNDYVTLVLLGKDINKETVEKFITAEQVKGCFPENFLLQDAAPCKCYPFINVQGAKRPFDDNIVLIGDSASSKLYKNGIGAAYITGRAAAKAAIFEGISKNSFEKMYVPACKSLDRDNQIGKLIFLVTKIIQRSSLLKKAVLNVVLREQKTDNTEKLMSLALWDTFTGSASYGNIFKRFFHPVLLFNLIRGAFSKPLKTTHQPQQDKHKDLGQLYKNGEVIIKQGTLGNCLFVIQEGKVEVINEHNGEDVKLAELGETEFFGEMGLFEKDVRSCTVRALGDARVLTIDKKNFYESIQNDASLAYRLLEKMSNRLRDANKMINV